MLHNANTDPYIFMQLHRYASSVITMHQSNIILVSQTEITKQTSQTDSELRRSSIGDNDSIKQIKWRSKLTSISLLPADVFAYTHS